MWFDEIMDDCKQAFATANRFKSIFIPIFLNLVLIIAIFISVFTSIISIISNNLNTFGNIDSGFHSFIEILPSFLIMGLIVYLIVLIGSSIIEVGSINMYKAALSDIQPRFGHFIEGIKKYLLKVILGRIFLGLLTLLTAPIWIVLFLLYFAIAGTLTGGWGIFFLSAFISVYFSTWISILVIEGDSPLKALGKSIKLGRKYFKGLFVILLTATVLTSYSISIFGILGTIVASWFIAGVISTCYKLVLMLIYYRNKENLE